MEQQQQLWPSLQKAESSRASLDPGVFKSVFQGIVKMAHDEQVISWALPPTQYINLFTDENVRRNRVPKPPPPVQDGYTVFGAPFNNDELVRSLESQNIKRLIPLHFDRRKELKKLNHSLFVNYLDLVDLLIQYPDSPRRPEKVSVCVDRTEVQ